MVGLVGLVGLVGQIRLTRTWKHACRNKLANPAMNLMGCYFEQI